MFQIIPFQANLLNPSMSSSFTPWFGFSSSASPENVSDDPVKTSEESKVTEQNEQDNTADQTKESGYVLFRNLNVNVSV